MRLGRVAIFLTFVLLFGAALVQGGPDDLVVLSGSGGVFRWVISEIRQVCAGTSTTRTSCFPTVSKKI
jgi:hypothetical protein